MGRLNPVANDLRDTFAADAGLFPHMLEMASDQILLSRIDEQAFRAASFLDQRIFTPELQRQLVPWSALEDIKIDALPPPHYIFHIGHVGSTLISRLLGEFDDTLALREPLILRNLAEISQIACEPQSPWSPALYETRRDLVISWLSRGFHGSQRPLIKASSFVSVLAEQLVTARNKALFLFVPLQSYMQTILAGEASMQETQVMAGSRLQRLAKLLGEAPANLWELSAVQRVAMSWLCEMATLQTAAKTVPGEAVLWHSFDDFLSAPADRLAMLAEHFGLSMPPEELEKLVSGPIMSSYSKAPEHGYSPDLRRDLQREAQAKHAGEIQSAMAWAEKLGDRYPVIGEVLSRA